MIIFLRREKFAQGENSEKVLEEVYQRENSEKIHFMEEQTREEKE